MKAVNDGDFGGIALPVFTLGNTVDRITNDGTTVYTFAASKVDRVLEIETDQIVYMLAGVGVGDPTSTGGTKLLADTPTRYGLLANHTLKFVGDTNSGYIKITTGGRRS